RRARGTADRRHAAGRGLGGARALSDAPRVSIVLPSHDGARYLDTAIESWHRQTYAAFELVLVDDGSIDDTRARAKAWCARDARIRLTHHDVVRRLPAALNTGFALTRGEYL